jgi:hypothetical protein
MEKENCVKRIFSALAAVVSVAAMTLGAAGTASAEQEVVPQPAVIAQVAVGFQAKSLGQFITIETPNVESVTIDKPLYVTATFKDQSPIVLATIPAGATFHPGEPYLIAQFPADRPPRCPVDLPVTFPTIAPSAQWDSLTVASLEIPRLVDKANVSALSTLRPRQALHRESVADGTFTKGVRQPCEYIPLVDLLPMP